MPLVDIDCPTCGPVEDIWPVEQAGRIPMGHPCLCPDCNGEAMRVLRNSVNQDCGENIRFSRALGVHPDLVASGEAYKIHPGANFVKTPGGMFALEIKGRSEKLRRMKERAAYTGKDFVERDPD